MTMCYQDAYRSMLECDAAAYRLRLKQIQRRDHTSDAALTACIRKILRDALPEAMASNDIRAAVDVPCDTKQMEQALRRLSTAGEIEYEGKVVVRSRVCNLYRARPE